MPIDVRICPLCEKETGELTCPTDGVLTLEPAIFSGTSHELGVGSVVAERYRITDVLGKGGMGAVFVATQLSMNRTVALKVLRRDVTQTPRHVKRFYQEAQAASQLNHPNIVRVFDFGIDPTSREPFIAMELIEGTTLNRLLEAGPLEERRAALIMSQVAKALVEAHEKQIVHRDLKPDNIMISRLPDGDEHVRVLDFGVAKMMRPDDSANDSGNSGGTPPRESLTATGSTVGTPLYMSPEQVSGERVDFRSDLYALGCILHEALTGAPPFMGAEAIAVLMKHVNEPAPALPDRLASGTAPSRAMVVLHDTLLAKPRLLRPASTALVARTLAAIARGEAPDVGSIADSGLTPRSAVRSVDIKAATLTSSEMPLAQPPPVEGSKRAVWIAAGAFALVLGAGVFALSSRSPEPAPVMPVVEAAPAPIVEAVTPTIAAQPQQPIEQPAPRAPPAQKKLPALRKQR